MGKPEKQITKEQLEQLYVQERRSVKYCAAFFDCDITTLRRHLVRKGIRVRSQSEEMTGRKLTADHREKVIKNLALGTYGEDNPAWKGGKSWKGRTKEQSYVIIRVGNRYVPEHRYVIEQHIGRKLHSKEHVHHIDGNKRNNDPKNLLVLTASEHTKLHMTEKHREHLSDKSREARAGRYWSTKPKP